MKIACKHELPCLRGAETYTYVILVITFLVLFLGQNKTGMHFLINLIWILLSFYIGVKWKTLFHEIIHEKVAKKYGFKTYRGRNYCLVFDYMTKKQCNKILLAPLAVELSLILSTTFLIITFYPASVSVSIVLLMFSIPGSYADIYMCLKTKKYSEENYFTVKEPGILTVWDKWI